MTRFIQTDILFVFISIHRPVEINIVQLVAHMQYYAVVFNANAHNINQSRLSHSLSSAIQNTVSSCAVNWVIALIWINTELISLFLKQKHELHCTAYGFGKILKRKCIKTANFPQRWVIIEIFSYFFIF